MNFPRRIKEYEKLSKREFPEYFWRDLNTTRDLRNKIVHQAYRITSNERGMAQRSVDTGRWIFNWFENDMDRRNLREQRIGFRSLGRSMPSFFVVKITQDGVEVSQKTN